MAISRISAATSTGNSVSIGTHAVGDFICVFAFNDNSTTIPSLPTGWINHAALSSTSLALRIGYKTAQSSTETSGTWTNADGCIAVVYRSDAGLIVPQIGNYTSATGTVLTYGSILSQNSRDSVDSWFLGLAAMRSDTNSIETAPSTMSNVTSLTGTGWKMAWHDTNATASSLATATVTVVTSALWRASTFMINEQPYPTSGGGFRPVNIRGGADQ